MNASLKDFDDPIAALTYLLERLSAEEIAKRLGVHPISIWRWVSARSSPRSTFVRRELKKLAEETPAGILPGHFVRMGRFGLWAMKQSDGCYKAGVIDRQRSPLIAVCDHPDHSSRFEAHGCAKQMLAKLLNISEEEAEQLVGSSSST